MRFLFTTAPLPGHLFPLVPLAWAARVAGHEVLVVTADAFVGSVVRTGLPVAGYGPAPDFLNAAAQSRDPSAGPEAGSGAYQRGRLFGRMAAAGLDRLRQVVADWKPDLLISERAEFAGPIVAALTGIPQVEYHWGVAPLPEYRAGATAELDTVLGGLGLDALPAPAEVLDPWPSRVRLPHAVRHHSARYVGYSGDSVVPDWALRRPERPRVCLTLGTLVPRMRRPGEPDLLRQIVEELARLDVELLVAVDPDVVADWPPLPTAVRVAGRLPLAQVLPTCRIAINHGGHGSVLAALATGIPQIALPQFDDQFENAQVVVTAGAGHSLRPEGLTPQLVARTCGELLHDEPAHRGATRVAADLSAVPPLAQTVTWLEKWAG
jgi:UDP:flavonoid glycosyltransferase YjiC (YdhE family)